jgi:hypothetical protein
MDRRVMTDNNIGGRFDAEDAARSRAKAPSPWSVRGVSREARAKAAKAAARRRETIGEWVTNALTQAANDELGTGPRRETSANVKAGLPAGPEQDETPLGKALLALAERFERAEKRNDALVSLARRVDGIEHGGHGVSAMAEQMGLVEQRSRALTLLVDRLEAAEQREKSLLTLMHSVAERAERGEERIAAITRGLADLAVKLEAALHQNRVQTAESISTSMAPLENAVHALSSRVAAAPQAAPQQPQAATPPSAPPSGATQQLYGQPITPLGGAAAGAAHAAPGHVHAAAEAAESESQDGGEEEGRLKFDFHKLNARAIANSQRIAQDSDDGGKSSEKPNSKSRAKSDSKSSGKSSGGWFGKSRKDGRTAKAAGGDDWAEDYIADEAPAAVREPTLNGDSPSAPQQTPPPAAASEEDEMLAALKHAIKPEKD